MKQDSNHTPHPLKKPLVSIERQYETDVATGRTEARMFVKMYFAARDSGLLADIGDRRWRTLCCLATYMDENGRCWPSQDTIARDLGVSRQRANERVRDLATYRFEGKPLIHIDKRRLPTKHGGRFANNAYEILSISGLGIFNREPVSSNPDTGVDCLPESEKPDIGNTPVSVATVTAKPDTNKSQTLNQTFNVERDAESCSHEHDEDDISRNAPADAKLISSGEHAMTRRTLARRHPSSPRIDRGPTPIGESLTGFLDGLKPQALSNGEIQDLVSRIEDATGDRHSRRRFQAIAQRVPKHVIEQLLASIKDAGSDLHNAGAFFEKRIQTECQALEIELPGARRAVAAPPKASPPGRSDAEAAARHDERA